MVSGWKVRRRPFGPSRWSRSAADPRVALLFLASQRGSGCRVIRSPGGGARPLDFLQDQARPPPSPSRPIPAPAGAPRPQLLPRLPAGQPLVDEDDLQADGRQPLPERPCRGRLRPLAAVHVARQAQHDRGVAPSSRASAPICSRSAATFRRRRAGRAKACRSPVADRHADAPAAMVQPDHRITDRTSDRARPLMLIRQSRRGTRSTQAGHRSTSTRRVVRAQPALPRRSCRRARARDMLLSISGRRPR